MEPLGQVRGNCLQDELSEKPFPHPLFERNLSYGTPNDEAGDFQEVSFETSKSTYGQYMHAGHAMIFCLDDAILWQRYPKAANIMMQMRFDGNLGFPGGLLDKNNEAAIDGLNRELEEELALDLTTCFFVQGDHVVSHVNHSKKLVTHFYAKCVSPDQYGSIERHVLQADDWGTETFGVIRVPLYAMDDGYRGLPVFLANKFSGNAREQLLIGIRKHHILPESKLAALLEANKKYEAAKNK